MLLEAKQGQFVNCAFGTSLIKKVQDYGKFVIPSVILTGICLPQMEWLSWEITLVTSYICFLIILDTIKVTHMMLA